MMDTDAARYGTHYVTWMDATVTSNSGIAAQTMEYVASKLTEEETGGAMEAVMDGDAAAPFVKFHGDLTALRTKTDKVQSDQGGPVRLLLARVRHPGER